MEVVCFLLTSLVYCFNNFRTSSELSRAIKIIRLEVNIVPSLKPDNYIAALANVADARNLSVTDHLIMFHLYGNIIHSLSNIGCSLTKVLAPNAGKLTIDYRVTTSSVAGARLSKALESFRARKANFQSP